MAFTDRELACRDCGGPFIFTAGEQEFYATKGLQHDPVRCPSCRNQRKLLRPEDREETPRFGVYVSYGGRTPRQMHRAACNQCAQSTEVPFVPRGDRPVYCSACYSDIREKQEARDAAAADDAVARIAAASMRRGPELEGAGPGTRSAVAEPLAEMGAAVDMERRMAEPLAEIDVTATVSRPVAVEVDPDAPEPEE
jgi:CxxC-x17-CxxC domain-containing protein